MEFLSQSFMLRALIAGLFFGISCGFLGVFLVLRRTAMVGEGLAHFSFGMVGLALFLNIFPFALAIPMAILGALLILELSEHGKRYGDAVIGMLSAGGIALGTILAKMGEGFNIDLFSYLFGDILTVSNIELALSILLCVIVVTALSFFYYDLFSITFDPEFSKVSNVRVNLLNRILAILTGLIVVVGIKVMGVMLVSSMIIFPAITSLGITRGFRATIFLSGFIGAFSVLSGIILAYLLDWPAGATIVAMLALLYLFSLFCIKLER